MKPTSLSEIASWCACTSQSSSSLNTVVQGVSVDSRLTKPGDLFFALPGARVDGHHFLAQAYSQGAKAAVVHSTFKGSGHGLDLIYVDDVLLSLKTLARRFIKESGAKIVAVTGSVGKTTTKEFIAALLRSKLSVLASVGNQNSQIGLPLTILNESRGNADVLVLEMGMTHAGDISKLMEIAPPDIAVVTSVALVHACNFDSMSSIARAKGEIFGYAGTEMGIYPFDSEMADILKSCGSCDKRSFSVTHDAADYFLNVSGKCMQLCVDGKVIDLPLLNVMGEHNRHNFLAAAIVANYCGLTWQEIALAMPALSLPERRLQVVEKLGATFINDSYNACEVSVKAALSSLPASQPGNKRIAVIGEMLELGKFSDECHQAVGLHALDCVDRMICFGKACEPIYASWNLAGRHTDVKWAHNRVDLVAALKQQLEPGDVILLKGSRANELWKLLDEMQ